MWQVHSSRDEILVLHLRTNLYATTQLSKKVLKSSFCTSFDSSLATTARSGWPELGPTMSRVATTAWAFDHHEGACFRKACIVFVSILLMQPCSIFNGRMRQMKGDILASLSCSLSSQGNLGRNKNV